MFFANSNASLTSKRPKGILEASGAERVKLDVALDADHLRPQLRQEREDGREGIASPVLVREGQPQVASRGMVTVLVCALCTGSSLEKVGADDFRSDRYFSACRLVFHSFKFNFQL